MRKLVSRWSPDPQSNGAATAPVLDAMPAKPYWTRNVWLQPFLLEFDSISQAAKALRSIQRNWAPYPTRLHRRMALIAEALPPLPLKPKTFPFALPTSPMGSFTLLDEHLLLGSAACSSPFPNGEFSFVEDKIGPPSRAYRKLWEALLYAGSKPRPGDLCMDAGASPGGWTWALAGLGAKVIAIDRATSRRSGGGAARRQLHEARCLYAEAGRYWPRGLALLRCYLLSGSSLRMGLRVEGFRPGEKLYLHDKDAGRLLRQGDDR